MEMEKLILLHILYDVIIAPEPKQNKTKNWVSVEGI